MKRRMFFTAVLLMLVATVGMAQEHFYGMKAGRVKQKVSVMGQEQVSEAYFDDWGNIQGSITQGQGAAGPVELLTVKKGPKVTIVNLTEKEGISMTQAEGAEEVNYLNLTDAVIDKYQMLELEEKQVILGHECTGYNLIQEAQGQQLQVTAWVWNGIPLKSEIKMGGVTQVTEVLELEEVTEVPAKFVTVPEDVKITEM